MFMAVFLLFLSIGVFMCVVVFLPIGVFMFVGVIRSRVVYLPLYLPVVVFISLVLLSPNPFCVQRPCLRKGSNSHNQQKTYSPHFLSVCRDCFSVTAGFE